MMGRKYVPPALKKGSFTMDNTVVEMKDYSLIMEIMFKAIERTIEKGYGGTKDYENPNFRMQLASSAGAPIRSMQISGGMKDGSIAQAEMTSCGLNGGDLPGKGEYSATLCCNLTNGKMPQIANRICKNIPVITHAGTEWYIGNATKGTQAGCKYFSIQDNTVLHATARGKGIINIKTNDESVGNLTIRSEKWTEESMTISRCHSHAALWLTVEDGSLDILSLNFSQR